MKPFYVYLLHCSDGSYYAGHTDDIEWRMTQHQDGRIGYTSTRKPVKLVWQGEFESREGALAFEQQIKGWSRAKKEALVRGDWDQVRELAKSGGGAVRAELGEGPAGAGLRQAQPERAGGAAAARSGSADPVRAGSAEAVRAESGEGPAGAGLRQAQPELAGGAAAVRAVSGDAVRPGSADTVHAGSADPVRARSADPVRARSADPVRARSADPVRPEPVEGLLRELLHGVLEGNRRAIAKSITLLESTRADHRTQGDHLLTALLPHTGNAFRLGISGVPGVGKSTFIEALGLYLIEQGHRVAVLTIDPSSTVSGGSILGDKTRMERLSVHEKAYIRPSPSAGTLGGVADKTREAMLVCEAAGYDVVVVETVGVGQSETAVAGMTDMFVLLQLPNAGDDLQAIKKGVMELADLVAINKADLDPDAATRAQAQITSAMRLLTQQGRERGPWQPQVLQLSALTGEGVDRFWQAVARYRELQAGAGAIEARRRHQALAWMWERIERGLKHDFRHHPRVKARLPELVAQVEQGAVPASTAARQLLALWHAQT